MQDEKLIGLLRSDPERGMEQLVKQYCGLVYAVIRGKLLPDIFSEADVDHCVGDTFSEFYCGLDRYSPQRGSIRSWLCVMAKNNALDRLRSHCREAGNVSLDGEGMVELPDDFSLEVDFENREQRRELLLAVKALPDPDREILLRKYYLGQSAGEIARRLHMSVSNVNTRTHRAIQKLRSQFGGNQI